MHYEKSKKNYVKQIMGKDDLIQVRGPLVIINVSVVFIASIVLLGWMFDATLFKSLLPSFSPMNPLTAMLFFIFGIAVMLLNTKSNRKLYSVGRYLAALATLLVIIRLVGFVEGFDVEIDRFFFHERLDGSRMVFSTTICFLFIGLGLLTIDMTNIRIVPSQIFTTIVFSFCFFITMGYVSSSDTLDKITVAQIPMAIHTACSFMLLSIAILMSRHQNGFMRVVMQKTIGSSIFRILLYIFAIVPLIVALIRYADQKSIIPKTEFQTPIIIISTVSFTFFMIWMIVRKFNRIDDKRRAAYVELKHLKNVLTENETKYRNLVNNAGVMMYTVTLDGLVTFASDKCLEITGYTPEEFTGMRYTQCVTKEHVSILKDTHRQQIEAAQLESSNEFCISTKNGDTKWIGQTTVLLFQDGNPSGFQCIAKDIAETKHMQAVLKKYEAMLVQNQERLQAILDNATSLIYIKDLEGKYLLTNKKFKAFYDITDDKELGSTDFDFADVEQAQRFKDTDVQVLQTVMPVELEEVIQTIKGRFTMLIVKFPLIDAGGEVYGISGIATDITDMANYREKLILARKAAEDAKKMQEQFLANMSHEIRTPMNGIQGMTSLLLETELNDEQKDYAKTIKKSSDNLIVIINDILDFSKMTAGKLAIERIDFNIFELLEDIKAAFQHEVMSKGLLLHIQTSKNVPDIVNGDPYRLNQILVNLVGNAIKFTQTGSITINIFAVENSLTTKDLHFEVMDTGIGIQPDKLHDIFESFTQASIETSRKYGGTGLGLAITKQLVELQNGTITVSSYINLGTTFEFYIPYNIPVQDSKQILAVEELKNYSTIFKGKKFLVAEDNEINQKVIRQVITKASGSVQIANNGLEAINILKVKTDFDIIIMDLQMPEMDGYAATRYIRNVLKLSIPIVAMTASALKDEKFKCLEMGMDDYLTKPFNISFVYKRISQLLQSTLVLKAEQIEIPKTTDSLFDLSILEEMEDDEYMEDILSLFLANTPVDLKALQDAAIKKDLDSVHAMAHKLKSSIGLVQANPLLDLMTKVEELAREGNGEGVAALIQPINNCYAEIEDLLQERLEVTRLSALLSEYKN